MDPTGYSAWDHRAVERALDNLLKHDRDLYAAVQMYYKPWTVQELAAAGFPFPPNRSQTYYDRLERARFNANNRPVMAVNGLLGMLNGAVAALGVTVGLLILHPSLVPVTLVGMVPLWVAENRNGRAWYRFAVDMTPVDRERAYLANTLGSKPLAKEVRAFGIASFLRDRFDGLYARRIAALRMLVGSRLRPALVGSVLASAGTALTLLLLFWRYN